MRHVSWLLAVLLCTTGNAAAGAAATPTRPEPGTRIRLTPRMPERQRWTGHFISIANDTVTMRAGGMDGAVLSVPMVNIARFEISRGTRSNALRGAGVGLVVGALGGAVYGVYAAADQPDVPGPGAYSVLGAAVFGLLGAAMGAGSAASSEQWHAVPLNDLRTTTSP